MFSVCAPPHSSELDLDSAPAAKRPRQGDEEEEVDFTMASLAKGEVTKVSMKQMVLC